MLDGVVPHCRPVYNDALDDAFGRTRPHGLQDDTWWYAHLEGYRDAADARNFGQEQQVAEQPQE